MTPRGRLAVLVAAITVLPVVLWVWSPLSVADLRAWVDGYGDAAPFVWVPVSALLGAALLPGPLLAGVGGALFGPWVGTITTVCSAVLSAVVSREIGACAGASGAREVLGSRADLVADAGFEAVLVQRLAPGIPDAPLSYAFGALGVRRWALALGTALGTLPRAFSYTALGASLDDPTSPLAWVALAGVVLSAVLGLLVLRRFIIPRRHDDVSRQKP